MPERKSNWTLLHILWPVATILGQGNKQSVPCRLVGMCRLSWDKCVLGVADRAASLSDRGRLDVEQAFGVSN
jgi:hypothetical protein